MNLYKIRAISGATGKWVGRLAALLLMLFWGMFFVEHLSEWFLRGGGRYPPAWVWVQQGFHFIMLVGLGLMIKWDKLGTLVTVIATTAFFAGIGFHTFPFIALINLVPIACFSVYWLATPHGSVPSSVTALDVQGFTRRRKTAFAMLLTAFGAILLLFSNEVFANPPLMTPTLHPSSALAGSWQAKADALPGPTEIEILFTVNSDGAVSGKIGGAVVTGARITCNRTWLGRLMELRTDFIIRGELAGPVGVPPLRNGDRFSAPISLKGADLVGSIFTAGKDTRGDRVTPAPLVSWLRLKKL